MEFDVDSDDEPLSNKIATSSKIDLSKIKAELKVTAYDKPADVWLYMKDLNISGPYSCLLCSEWFINRSKLILHYILNHKKEYCGICRYFVEDREAWATHWSYHEPFNCSHCDKSFPLETDLRRHFSKIHGFVHCRLCYFLLPDGVEYENHLNKKHYATLFDNRDEELFWNADDEISAKFICLLCEKQDLRKSEFFRHYMCYHRFTLKCLTGVLSGRDVPFLVFGASMDTNLCGGVKGLKESENLLQALIPEIKQEVSSDGENCASEPPVAAETPEIISEMYSDYTGKEDFDVTLLELILFRQNHINYIESVLNDLNTRTIPTCSSLKKNSTDAEYECALCLENGKSDTHKDLSIHSAKMHGFKYISQHECRCCLARFNSESELASHSLREIDDFKNLYLCQFCDISFDDRISAMQHLAEHWDCLTTSNCTSPQVGFKCKYCSELFWNEYEREGHHCRTHYVSNKNNFYKCADCQKIFSDKIWFSHHHWKYHRSKNDQFLPYMVKCLICCTVFENFPHVKEHFQFWHPEAKKIFCSLGECSSKPFTTTKSLKIHVKNFHSSTSMIRASDQLSLYGGLHGTNICGVCGREFSSSRATASHMALAHGAGRFKCKLCDAMLNTSDERKLHYLLKHPGHAPFECTVCGKRFHNKSTLYSHRTQQHVSHLQTFTCSYCGKTFTKRDSYREHLMIHTGPCHVCSYCPRRFVQRSNMLRHERRHTGERPYTCAHCGRAFADKGACNAHMRTHMNDQAYSCTYCGQTFTQKPKLKYHIRKHTGENLETCPICSKLFTSVCTLREHMKIHDENEKVPCTDCGKVFTSTRYLVRHMRAAHSGCKDSHDCPICSKKFSTIIKLRSHVLTHCQMKTLECTFCRKKYSSRKAMMTHLHLRHQMMGTNDILKTGYTRLDPRDCDLKLDDKTITQIFGKSRRSRVPVELKDYVLFPKSLPSMVADRINKINENGMAVASIPVSEKSFDDDRIVITLKIDKSTSEELTKDDKLTKYDVIKKKVKRKRKNDKPQKSAIETDIPQHSNSNSPLFPFISIKCEPID